MPKILNHSPFAAISFKDRNGTHITIYYQDRYGVINETFYDDGIGWHLRDLDVIGHAKLNTGIAATTWDNGTQVCRISLHTLVYYTNN